jgi:hypothetical protein
MKDGDPVGEGEAFRLLHLDEQDGMPQAGTDFAQLGARVPRDIRPDAAGEVSRASDAQSSKPGLAGMSVFIGSLPPESVPVSKGGYLKIRPDAATPSVCRIPVASLRSGVEVVYAKARPGRAHAVVRPQDPVPLEAYQGALAATRAAWEAIL